MVGVLASKITSTERSQDLQAQDADDCDEESHAEHEGEEKFLALVELELGDDCQWQAQDDDVEYDVDCCRGPTLGVDVIAYSRSLAMPVLPGVRNWSTLPHGDQQKCNGVASASAHCDEAGYAEPSLWEYAEVEEEH